MLAEGSDAATLGPTAKATRLISGIVAGNQIPFLVACIDESMIKTESARPGTIAMW